MSTDQITPPQESVSASPPSENPVTEEITTPLPVTETAQVTEATAQMGRSEPMTEQTPVGNPVPVIMSPSPPALTP